MKNKIAVLSFSGGMDSTSLLLNLIRDGYKVHALSFDYGQKHVVELEWAKKNITHLQSLNFDCEHQVIDLRSAMGMFHSALTDEAIDVPEGHYAEDNMKATVVPNRNAIFASLIYGYALSLATKHDCTVKIALGVHAGDHAIYPDCRPEFYDALSHAFRIGNWESEKVEYYLPYINGDKFSILQDAKQSCSKLNLDFTTLFRNTNTCYSPNSKGESCGRCGSCSERLEAFKKINIADPAIYALS